MPTFAPLSRKEGHLAQLVQSVCLTSRGSGVRIPQCPLPFPQVARRSSERMNIFPERALSSVGSERLPYKQRVGGSNPSVPTKKKEGVLNDFNAPSFCMIRTFFLFRGTYARRRPLFCRTLFQNRETRPSIGACRNCPGCNPQRRAAASTSSRKAQAMPPTNETGRSGRA